MLGQTALEQYFINRFAPKELGHDEGYQRDRTQSQQVFIGTGHFHNEDGPRNRRLNGSGKKSGKRR